MRYRAICIGHGGMEQVVADRKSGKGIEIVHGRASYGPSFETKRILR
jgi:hypothetical protein